MERRSLLFVLVMSTMLFGMILMFRPQDPEDQPGGKDGEPGQVAQVDPEKADKENKADEDGKPEDKKEGDTDPEQVKVPTVPEAEHEFFTIGSLAADSPFKMLVTLNNKGASVTRVELNQRLAKGRYKYRHIDDHSGYIGQLGLVDTKQGCRIRVVGTATPAEKAGLKTDDIIVAINQVDVANLVEYQAEMRKTRPKDEVTVRVIRDEEFLDFKAVLTFRPLETIRPEPEDKTDPTLQHPESFLATIRKYGEPDTDWAELDASLLKGNWKGEKITDAAGERVVFEKRISAAAMAKAGFSGELLVKKTYRISSIPAADRELDFPFAYHFNMDVSIEQIGGGEEPQLVSLQLNGPTGAPTEGWWYTNKIHGEATALFKTAGARDVVLSTKADGYSFISGPDIFTQALSDDGDVIIKVFPAGTTTEERTIKYAGVDAQYFTVSLIPESDHGPFVVKGMYLSPCHPVSKDDKSLRRVTDVTFRMYTDPISMTDGKMYQQSFKIFTGPKEPELLSQYGLDDVVSFGWFAWFSKILLGVLHLLYSVVRNYGLAIILLTVIVRVLMMPISRKAALNAQMMQMLQPEMKKLADKYKDDMEKRGQKQRELFKKYNYNPMGGCGLMFLQLPIFIGLYRGLSVDMALRDQPLIPGLAWCSNLAGPDQLLYWKEIIPLPWLTGETGFLGPWLNILPLITVVLFLVQQKLFTPPPQDEQQAMTQKMMTFMMLFMGLMFFKVPAGLCIYFITSSLWGICERKLLPKPELDKSKYEGIGGVDDDAEEQKPGKPAKPKAPKRSIMDMAMQRPKTNGTISADDRKRRDKERQRKLKNKKSD